jgi:hypothetical protein
VKQSGQRPRWQASSSSRVSEELVGQFLDVYEFSDGRVKARVLPYCMLIRFVAQASPPSPRTSALPYACNHQGLAETVYCHPEVSHTCERESAHHRNNECGVQRPEAASLIKFAISLGLTSMGT